MSDIFNCGAGEPKTHVVLQINFLGISLRKKEDDHGGRSWNGR